MTQLTDILRTVAFFSVGFYMLTYHLSAPWWRSQVGRTIMLWAGCEFSLLMLGMLQMLFGPGYWGQEVLRNIFFAGLDTAIIWQLLLLLKAQRDGGLPANLTKPPSAPDVPEKVLDDFRA